MLRPLPYVAPDRLVSLWEINEQRPGSRSSVAPANLVDTSATRVSFEASSGFACDLDEPHERPVAGAELAGEAVTWNYLPVLGVQPALGRSFRPEDDRPGREHVVILSDALWRSRFAGDRSIVGRSITLNGEPYDVVGVMPPAFQPVTQIGSTAAVAFFVPAAYPDELLNNHGDHEIRVVGRLKPGVALQQGQADLLTVSTRLEERFPQTNTSVRARIAPLNDDIVRHVRTSLLVLLGAVGLVLLVACVNLANLMIVRAIGQRQEIAIRMALGASRGQLAVELLTRGVALAALGGAAGLLCGVWTRDALVALAPSSIPRLDNLVVSPRVLALTAVVSLATGILAALLPAVQMSRRDGVSTLRVTEQSGSSSRSIMRWRGTLMAAEIAAAMVLAIGAGLLVRSLARLNAVELGFETDRVLTVIVRLPDANYQDQRARATFFQELTPRIQAIPGVRHVAFANQFPMRGGWEAASKMGGTGEVRDADFQAVSPDYFAALGIPLVRGRLLTAEDRDGSQHVAVVSQTFVREFAGDPDPIGQQFTQGRARPAAGDDRRRRRRSAPRREGREAGAAGVPAGGPDRRAIPLRLSAVAIRATGDPHALVSSVQRAVWSIDPDQPITGVRTLDEVLAASTAQRRFNMTLLASLRRSPWCSALVGVYASSPTASRSARAKSAFGLPLARAGATSRVGREGGFALVARGRHRRRRRRPGVEPVDDRSAVWRHRERSGDVRRHGRGDDRRRDAASYIPARRAASVDPIAALRSE